MPFQKTETSAHGVTLNFHRIDNVSWDRSSGDCTVRVLSFINAAAAASGKEPLMNRVFVVPNLGNLSVIQTALKALPEFSTAVEV